MYRIIILRFLKLLKKFGYFKDIHKIIYTGKGVSLNAFYSQNHWYKRHQIKNQFRSIFGELFLNYGKMSWMDEFSIIIFYNSRHDPDNVVGMGKLLVDFMKQETDKEGNVTKEGFVKDDSKLYYKGLVICPDTNLPNNTFEFIILSH
jgi:hypothetical protein